MLIVARDDGHLAVTQLAHAWVSGQLARAWGGGEFAAPSPREEVCLAAEQHDVGMAHWDRDPELHPDSGLPRSFMQMELTTHLRQWSEGPELLLGQSRYAALLASMHGSALYGRRDRDAMEAGERTQVIGFLEDRHDFEAAVRATLPVGEQEIAANQRLIWTWDGLSLALILGWAPWTAEAVPVADGRRVGLELRALDGEPGPTAVHVLRPWPFAAPRLVVRTQGRLLKGTYDEREALRRALAAARWVDLSYELRPG